MTRKKASRPRGGQPGNTNALKHGLYATALPTQYRQNLPQTTAGTVQAEIDLLRLLLANTLTGIAELTASSEDQTSTDPFDDSVRFLNIATYTTAAINRLIRLTDDPQSAEQEFWLELSMLADEVRQEMAHEK